VDSNSDSRLRELAARLNVKARADLAQDGRRAASVALQREDRRLFDRSLAAGAVDRWGQQIADAARQSDAHAVVLVCEGRRGQANCISTGHSAAEAMTDDDLLLVAALDRAGHQVIFESRVLRRTDRRPELEQSVEWGSEFYVGALQQTRTLWDLPQRVLFYGGAFSAEIPRGWSYEEDQDVIELTPVDPEGAGHFSVLGREPVQPAATDAVGLVARFIRDRGDQPPRIEQRQAPWGFSAVATVSDPEQGSLWVVGAAISPVTAIIYSYNQPGPNRNVPDAARSIFDSVVVSTSR
jgi:hypothetical protein